MQQVQQRGLPERVSWARAFIFAVGFFLLAAILLGQLPSYIYIQMTGSSLQGFETGSLSLGLICLAGFAVIQVIMLMFDPKPVIPPMVITVLGAILSLGGLALTIWTMTTGCDANGYSCNQYFPSVPVKKGVSALTWNPVLGGKVLWFQPRAVDLLMVGLLVLGVGVAWIFYSQLALREQRNPDRRDLGTTPTIRWMLIASIMLLIVFLVFYNTSTQVGDKMVNLVSGIILGAAIFMALGAFALRLHYLMRPVRKNTMSGLYAVGALGLAQLGVILIIAWFAVYPFIFWLHTVPGLGPYLTVCSKPWDIPASCAFTQDAASLVDTIVTSSFFGLLVIAIWAWKTHRNLVVIGSVVTTAVIAITALLMHLAPDAPTPDQPMVAVILCIAILVLAAIWTIVARREFAVVGENNLGCLGMWLVVGTCLFIYIAAFAFFSIPQFADETEPNIPFTPGSGFSGANAMTVMIVLGILAAIQFYFLARNRYKV